MIASIVKAVFGAKNASCNVLSDVLGTVIGKMVNVKLVSKDTGGNRATVVA